MDGRFTDGKLLCRGADRGPVLYDVKSQIMGSFLHIAFQTQHSPPLVAPSYAAGKRLMYGREILSFQNAAYKNKDRKQMVSA